MSDLCKNCGTTVYGKYCHNCGQSVTTGRINFHYMLHELQHSLFHVDKGIFYTIKELLIRPGSTIREYLSGKRVSHYKPFAFVIIMGTIYGFICYFVKVYPEESIMPTYENIDTVEFTQQSFDWVYGHYSFVMLALIPFFALGSCIVFRKSYNYIEFLVVSSYITGIQIFILIITYIAYYFTLSKWAVLPSFLAISVYHIWAYIKLFDNQSRTSVIFKTTLSLTLSCIFVMITIFLGTIIFVAVHHQLRP